MWTFYTNTEVTKYFKEGENPEINLTSILLRYFMFQNCVYHTEMGQAIGKDSNVVYVSKDNKRTFQTLKDFTEGVNWSFIHLFIRII